MKDGKNYSVGLKGIYNMSDANVANKEANILINQESDGEKLRREESKYKYSAFMQYRKNDDTLNLPDNSRVDRDANSAYENSKIMSVNRNNLPQNVQPII